MGRRHRDLVGAHHRLGEMLQRHRLVVPLGEVAHQRVDVLGRMVGRHAGRPVGGVEIGAADDDHGNAVAPGIVDRHGRMLQADGAVAQHHQRLAGGLEVAMGHADRRFFVGAGDEFRLLVAAVVDQRLVQGAEARSRVGDDIVDVEGLDHVDHEVRSIGTMGLRQFLRDAGLGRDHAGIGPQRGRTPRRRIAGIGDRCGRGDGCVRRRHRSGGSRHRDPGHEIAPAYIRTFCIRIICIRTGLPLSTALACHHFLLVPRPLMRDACKQIPRGR